MHIGLRIKHIAEHHKVSVVELASLLGKSKQAIYDLFERPHVSTEILEKLSECLGVPLQVFLENTDFNSEKKSSIQLEKTSKNKSNNQDSTDKDILIETLQTQNLLLQEHLKFLQGLVSTQLGELRAMLMSKELTSSPKHRAKFSGSPRQVALFKVA